MVGEIDISINKFSLQKGNVLIVAERDVKGDLLQEVFRKQKIDSDVSVLGEYYSNIEYRLLQKFMIYPLNEYEFTILKRKRLDGLHRNL